MNFEQAIKEQKILNINLNPSRAKNLLKQSQKVIETARKITLNKDSAGSVLREIYEGIRQHAESLGYMEGYKFQTHDAISIYIEEKIGDKKLSLEFHRLRKLRNGLNYYGDEIRPETIISIFKKLEAFLVTFKEYNKKL